MNTKHYKIIAEIALWLSVAAAAVHLIWYAVIAGGYFDIQSLLLLNVLPYGVPILTFALVRREIRREPLRWNIADTVFGAIVLLCYFAMVINVTVEGCTGDFAGVYFNVPLLYAIPLCITGMTWLFVRMKPKADMPVIGKVLYALPLAAIAAMFVHCGILSIEALTSKAITSFPWWTAPFFCGIMYLIAVFLLFVLYALYYSVLKRKGNKELNKNN